MATLLSTLPAAGNTGRTLNAAFVSLLCAGQCSQRLAQGFLEYDAGARALARLAPERFQQRDWQGSQLDAEDGSRLRAQVMAATLRDIDAAFGAQARQPQFWVAVRRQFASLIDELPDSTCCRSFFSAVAPRALRGNGALEPVLMLLDDASIHDGVGCAAVLRPLQLSAAPGCGLDQVLESLPLDSAWRDASASAGYLLNQVRLQLQDRPVSAEPLHIELLDTVFYRFTRAYVFGRLQGHGWQLPLALALRNTVDGVVIDTVTLTDAGIAALFSDDRACFQVELERVAESLAYLQALARGTQASSLLAMLGRAH
jgi:isocitrate dehydrogenase kinase/phosphatase